MASTKILFIDAVDVTDLILECITVLYDGLIRGKLTLWGRGGEGFLR